MLISQSQALEKIKAATGLIEAECQAIVKSLPKRPTGKREKVWLADVEKAIADALRPITAVPVKAKNVRPFSAKLVGRIRRQGARI